MNTPNPSPKDNLTNFPWFKARLFSGLWKLQLLGLALTWFFAKDQIWSYVYGCILAWFYLKSITSSAEHPQKAMSAVQTVFRMLLAAVLIILLGQRDLLKTSIVFLGFLSYKGVLIVELTRILIRTLIGNWRHSDQRSDSPLDDSGGPT